MLRSLSGRTHFVYTGIAITQVPLMETISSYQMTEVTFRILEDDEIYAYISTGSPMDKAGAYGIQEDFGAVFVQKIVGCYYNIVGLPLEMIYGILRSFQN
jgi:septum formation protein